MVDLQAQYESIKDEVDAAMQEVIDTTSFIRGAAVEEFEDELGAHLDGVHALGVASGTDALQIALMALGVGRGDEVVTTPFTFIATAEAAALLGAEPVFVDIDPDTFNLDVDQVADALTARTKAIVPVHLFGQPCDMDPLLEVADRHDIPVVEDCAQSINARYSSRQTGSMGTIGCLSFFPSKNLGAFGDGGAVLARDEGIYRTMKSIANHGAEKKYYHQRVGINSRLDAIQAAVLRVKLQHLDAYTEARREAADRYDALLGDLDAVTTPYRADNRHHVFHQYTIKVNGSSGSRTRDALSDHLDARDIPHAVYYPRPLHHLPVFEQMSDNVPTLPVAERCSDQVLSLPMHTELTAEQQETVADAIKQFFGS